MIKIPYLLQDVYNSSKLNKFKIISTFAGCGGSSTGYKLAGGNVLCANEFIQSAIDTYLFNYPETPILKEDIRDLAGKDFLSLAKLNIGELDILDGSPPCASFSSSGKGQKLWGKVKKYSETKQMFMIWDVQRDFLAIIFPILIKMPIL